MPSSLYALGEPLPQHGRRPRGRDRGHPRDDIDYWVEGGKIDLKPWEVIVVGDGDQAAAVERLRSELEERGWFDDEQKQRPPAFPERVGVVTSYVAMPVRHQNAIHEQDPTVDILIKDATVQGSDAPTSIANGIHHLDRSEDVDAIIVGRAGERFEPQAFNTERVAEAIFTANTRWSPIIGHTDDRLIADQVTDVATITPTAAGEYIVNSARSSSRARSAAGAATRRRVRNLPAGARTRAGTRRSSRQGSRPEGLSPVYYKAAIAVLECCCCWSSPGCGWG